MSLIHKPEDHVVVSGVATSEIGRQLERSGFGLTLDAVRDAVADAGLTMSDIDGLATYPGMTSNFVPGFVGPDIYEIQDALGLQLNWHLATPQGAAQIAPLIHAVLAVSAGLCRHAVVFRTVTESSGQQGGRRGGIGTAMPTAEGPFSWLLPFGSVSAANWAAMYAQRHFHEFGTKKEQLGWIAMTARAHAQLNPEAIFRTPLSMDDYMASRPISTPLSLFDCDVPIDGATAVVISAKETAPDLRKPIAVEAMGGALKDRPTWEQRSDLTSMAAHDSAAQMWSRTSLGPADVDVAELYDGFSIFTLLWLEAMGFCGPGEGGAFVEGGSRISIDGGDLPLNPSGGQLSAGRLHGWGFVADAVRQLRGEVPEYQVPDAEVAAIGVGGGVIAGSILLRKM